MIDTSPKRYREIQLMCDISTFILKQRKNPAYGPEIVLSNKKNFK